MGMKKKGVADYQLIYSSDPAANKRCPACKRMREECVCTLGPQKIAVRLERKGRGGKGVTVIYNLPPHNELLKKICKRLKQAMGTGGTFYIENAAGFVEIQGDHGPDILAQLKKILP